MSPCKPLSLSLPAAAAAVLGPEASNRTIARIVTVLAGLSALVTAVTLPLTYYSAARFRLEGTLESGAQSYAIEVAETARQNPVFWNALAGNTIGDDFEDLHIAAQPDPAAGTVAAERRRVYNSSGRMVIEAGPAAALAWPVLSARQPIVNGTGRLGDTEVARSLRGALVTTIGIGLVSGLMGTIMFMALCTVPLRMLRADAKMLVLRHRFEQAIDSTEQAIALFDAASRVVACNTAYLDLHKTANGVRPPLAAIVGRSYRETLELRIECELYAARDLADVERVTLIRDRLANGGGGGDQAEWTLRLADGRWIRIIMRRTPDHGIVEVWNDITTIKLAETQQRELEAQLHHSQRLESLGTLAGGIAHDLNNTLVPILVLTEITAEAMPEGSRERAALAIVTDAGRRAKRLVSQVLAFSRKEQAQLRVFDFAELVREALAMLRSAVPATTRIDQAIADVPVLEGDDGQLHQVIVNLIINASQAIGGDAGVITVSVRALPASGEATRIAFAVQDTGCGMDEATRARIFEPFFTTKAVNAGTGLGLSVVHGIIAAHGGTITVASVPGRGSTFEVILPVTRRGRDNEADGAATPAPTENGIELSLVST